MTDRAFQTRKGALAQARTIVAATNACSPDDLLRDEVTIVPAALHADRMPFHLGRPHLSLTTFGVGVVVTVSDEWVQWIRRLVRVLSRDDIFATQCLSRIQRHVQRSRQPFAGPQHRYVCAQELWREVQPPMAVEIECVQPGPAMDALYDLPFEHALGDRGNTERPDMVGVTARKDGEVVALAAASADHEQMWQIGVDVQPSYQGAGIGAAIVSQCTRAVLRAGRVPYYSTHLSNLRSQSVAIRCGFVSAWTEAYVYVPRGRRIAGDYLGEQRVSIRDT